MTGRTATTTVAPIHTRSRNTTTTTTTSATSSRPRSDRSSGSRDIEPPRIRVVRLEKQLQRIHTGLRIRRHRPDQVPDRLCTIDRTNLLHIERVVNIVRVHKVDLGRVRRRRRQRRRRRAGHRPGKRLGRSRNVRDTITHGLRERDMVEGRLRRDGSNGNRTQGNKRLDHLCVCVCVCVSVWLCKEGVRGGSQDKQRQVKKSPFFVFSQ
ncbi:hypothetical protein BC939DRAFT_452115 [Gamsiella multidivaricata]|uniref:uncharacterized protein n=1 Tax=Gamsiella multidivaricata TaxID=101098 RepID=UPI00221EA710|nr:uncharacterized protein BC939DRAFT_452115 [Gamsiella multidivaricata]KAI7823200.1 hypothetical protein BC939DRAFT_452115 [Gamsiella multidivaricata]